MNIQRILSKQLQIDEENISNVISLLDEGSTVAFISRYRKEKTGNLSDIDVRSIEKNLNKLRNIEKRQEEIISALESSNNLTDELKKQILSTNSLTLLEDIYNPFKKKRKTRADKARELGLEPLFKYLLNEVKSSQEAINFAKDFFNEDIDSSKEAIEKSLDILAEDISNNIKARNIVRRDGMIRARLKVNQKDDSKNVYQTYYDFNKKIKDLKSYQILAINRGEKEGALTVKVEFSDDYNKRLISDLYDSSNSYQRELIDKSVNDAYKRLILPSITTELRNYLTDMAENESIKVFSSNLKPYLLQKPIKGKTVMGLDPGFRTGCKVAVVDPNGKYLDKAVIYPVKPHKKEKESMDILTELIKKYNVKLIALGNATASRETEIFVNKLISDKNLDIAYAIVNEAGASVYSASALGEEEFPDLDVTIRGAISMARRLQDPMAELVKIEPKHIGVGQYQHDLNEKKLDDELSKVVEDTVNEVGVTINNASYKLLSYVSGLTPKLARRIEEEFKEGNLIYREDLKNIKGLGDKTYQLAAGFLRFPDSPEFLDNTAVHPESYKIAKKLKDYSLERIDVGELSQKLEVGELTLKDIIEELRKPGRDPREDNPEILTKSEIMSIDDLKIDDEMMGKVRNITDFGAFVDIGVGIDGLVHISNISDKFIKNPNEVLTNSDIVKVRVIEIDKDRQRIGLSMRDIN